MKICNHQFKATIRGLTQSDLAELLEILTIPRKLWNEKTSREGNVYQLQYGYGDTKESVRVHLGNLADGYMDQVSRITEQRRPGAYGQQKPQSGYVPYYGRAYILLHGSYFDHATGFNFETLLLFLERVGFTPHDLDIAFDDDEDVTTLNEWLAVFRSWRKHCVGNMLRKQKILVVEDEELFVRVQIGSANSKTAYGSFYTRDDGTKRLELKCRDSDQIRDVLLPYQEENREAYNERALKELVSNLDIFTAASRKTRKPAEYVRVPFWSKFLASSPKKRQRREIKTASQLSMRDSFDKGLKNITGRIQNLFKKHAAYTTANELADELQDYIDSLRLQKI